MKLPRGLRSSLALFSFASAPAQMTPQRRRSSQDGIGILLRAAVPPLIYAWEPQLNVKVSRFHVQHMKTKWGSCNPTSGAIRLNTELAKKPKEFCITLSCMRWFICLNRRTGRNSLIA